MVWKSPDSISGSLDSSTFFFSTLLGGWETTCTSPQEGNKTHPKGLLLGLL